MTPMRPAQFSAYPYARRKPAAPDVPADRDTQLKRDLRALEAVQRARPLKPPGRTK